MITFNIQLFGGRGAGNNLVSGVEITTNGSTQKYYFDKKDGVNYWSRGINGQPEEIPNNMTPNEVINRARKNGAEVRIINNSERQKEKENYINERKNRPDYELGYGTGNMREYARKAKQNRLATRTMKRK